MAQGGRGEARIGAISLSICGRVPNNTVNTVRGRRRRRLENVRWWRTEYPIPVSWVLSMFCCQCVVPSAQARAPFQGKGWKIPPGILTTLWPGGSRHPTIEIRKSRGLCNLLWSQAWPELLFSSFLARLTPDKKKNKRMDYK